MKKFLDGWYKVGERICHVLSYVSIVFIVAMMLIMFVDAMLGLFLNTRILGSYEIVQCMLCVVVFTSWAYTQAHRGHIHVTLFISKMHRIPRFLCYGITCLLSVITMVFGCVGVWRGIVEKIGNGEKTGTLLIPYWPLYIFELLAFILFIVLLLCEAVRAFIALGNKEIAADIESTWV